MEQNAYASPARSPREALRVICEEELTPHEIVGIAHAALSADRPELIETKRLIEEAQRRLRTIMWTRERGEFIATVTKPQISPVNDALITAATMLDAIAAECAELKEANEQLSDLGRGMFAELEDFRRPAREAT